MWDAPRVRGRARNCTFVPIGWACRSPRYALSIAEAIFAALAGSASETTLAGEELLVGEEFLVGEVRGRDERPESGTPGFMNASPPGSIARSTHTSSVAAPICERKREAVLGGVAIFPRWRFLKIADETWVSVGCCMVPTSTRMAATEEWRSSRLSSYATINETTLKRVLLGIGSSELFF